MKIYERALTSIKKRKGKTMILFLVIFLLGNLIAGASAIYNTSGQLESSMKKQLGAKARIDINYMNIKNPEDIKPITSDMADEIAKLPEVKSVSYGLTSFMGSEKIKKVTEDKKDENSGGMSMSVAGVADFANFTIVGFKNDFSEELSNGKIQITEGRYPKQGNEKNEILISKKLAEKNSLKLGDTVVFDHSLIEFDQKAQDIEVKKKTDYSFEIVGVYESTGSGASGNPMASMLEENQNNTIYTTFDFVNKLDLDDAKEMAQFKNGFCKSEEQCRSMVVPTYELTSPDVIEEFSKKATTLLNHEQYKVETTKDSFDSVAGSLLNLKDMSQSVLVFGIIGSVLILSLVLVLFMRDRKHEFGIYRALGESKVNSITQVLLEVMMVSIIAVSLALMSGSKVAEGLSSNMIKNQVKQNEVMNEGNMMISMGSQGSQLTDITEKEIADNFKVEMNQEYLVMFYGVMLGTAFLSTGVASIYILRLKPREILL